MPRRDRYNKKIEKFHVVVEEEDNEVSDLEETERHEATKDNPLSQPWCKHFR